MNGKVQEIASDDMAKETKNLSGKIEWLSYQDDYFMTAVVPENPPLAAFVGRSLPSGVIETEYSGPPLWIFSSEYGICAVQSVFLGRGMWTF